MHHLLRSVIHPRNDEQPDEAASVFSAAHDALHHLKVVDLGARLLGHIIAALHYEQLASRLAKTSQIGIAAEEGSRKAEPLVVFVVVEL